MWLAGEKLRFITGVMLAVTGPPGPLTMMVYLAFKGDSVVEYNVQDGRCSLLGFRSK